MVAAKYIENQQNKARGAIISSYAGAAGRGAACLILAIVCSSFHYSGGSSALVLLTASMTIIRTSTYGWYLIKRSSDIAQRARMRS